MKKLWFWSRRVILSLLLLGLLTGGLQVAAAGQVAQEIRIQPLLLEMAKREPNQWVNVIVQTKGGHGQPEVAVRRMGGQITSQWSVISGFAARVPLRHVERLGNVAGIRWVSFDSPAEAASKALDAKNLATAYPVAVKADKLWSQGYYGTGVTVAVLDSGIADSATRTNGDLGGRVIAQAKFATTSHMADKYGHGTHVAGILGGDGSASSGKYIGIAPRVNLINLKISDDLGVATERGIIDALDWVAKNHRKNKIRVVNISSTSGLAQACATSPLCAAVEQIWQRGIVVVVSAGNRGGVADAMHYPPANSPHVITVGAVWDRGTKDLSDDELASWSSRGATQDGHRKPDILAPGSQIASILADQNSVLGNAFPQNIVDGSYLVLGGTSMAAPVISGVVALMLEVDPNLTPNQVKWILTHTARLWKNQGTSDPGIVDAQTAAWYSKTNTPGEANQGVPVSTATGDGTDTTSFNMLYWATSHDL